MNCLASRVRGLGEKFRCWPGLDQTAAMQQHDLAADAFSLTEIVRRYHDLDPTRPVTARTTSSIALVA